MLDIDPADIRCGTRSCSSPKPYYAIQLCCYSEMLAAAIRWTAARRNSGSSLAARTELNSASRTSSTTIATSRRVSWPCRRLHRQHRRSPGAAAASRPWPLDFPCGEVLHRDRPPRAGRWHHGRADQEAEEGRHRNDGRSSPQPQASRFAKLANDSLGKLVAQARLQCQTRADRMTNPDAPPRYEVLPHAARTANRRASPPCRLIIRRMSFSTWRAIR